MEKVIDLEKMSSAELEKLLKEKQKAEKLEREKAKKEYEYKRDAMIIKMIEKAKILNDHLSTFKAECFKEIEKFREKAAEYGDIRSNSKGGFGLRTLDNKYLMKFERNVMNEFDERADMALTLIKEFLESTVKKRDLQSYKIISTLLTRNKAGDLNVSRVIQLLDLRNEFDDARWLRAIELLEESYRDRPISFGVSFYVKNEKTGKDELLPLNFTSVELIKNE